MSMIPEDLRGEYEVTALGRLNIGTWADRRVRELIERIAALTAERDAQAQKIETLENALRARHEADVAWRGSGVSHSRCHEMSKRAEEMALAALNTPSSIRPPS